MFTFRPQSLEMSNTTSVILSLTVPFLPLNFRFGRGGGKRKSSASGFVVAFHALSSSVSKAVEWKRASVHFIIWRNTVVYFVNSMSSYTNE